MTEQLCYVILLADCFALMVLATSVFELKKNYPIHIRLQTT